MSEENSDRTSVSPRVSVIIPTYNRPEFVEKAIASALNQTYQNLEVIVVQNGPSDVSGAVSEKFQKLGQPVRHVYLPKPCPVNARNEGVRVAKGELIAFLDDDDEWLPNKLAVQIGFYDKNPQFALVGCGVRIHDGKGNQLEAKNASVGGEFTIRKFLIRGGALHSLSCVLMRRKDFLLLGGFNPIYPISNDHDFYLRLLIENRMWCLPDILVSYRRHESNMTTDLTRAVDENMQILRAARKTIPYEKLKVSSRLFRVIEIKRSRIIANAGLDAYEAADFKRSVRYLGAAISRDPLIGLKLKWGKRGPFFKRLIRPYVFFVKSSMKTLR